MPASSLSSSRCSRRKTAEAGLRAATLRPVDLIVVDLGLPDLDGAAIVERVRAWSTVPIIVLSVRSSEDGKGAGARARRRRLRREAVRHGGASRARARGVAPSVARRRRRANRQSRAADDRSCGARVSLDGVRLQLSPKEYRLLQALAQHAGNVVTHQYLLKEVWGINHVQDAHYLRIFVRKLRQKIEKDPTRPRILVTELGVGYRLAPMVEHATRAE